MGKLKIRWGKIAPPFLRVMKIIGYAIKEIVYAAAEYTASTLLIIIGAMWFLSGAGLLWIPFIWAEFSTVVSTILTVLILGFDFTLVVLRVIRKYEL